MASKKLYKFAEVAGHNSAEDLWFIISGKVYDVTSFVEHPGGQEVFISAAGKDATNDFEDIGHSDAARQMMAKYYIGDVDLSTLPREPVFMAAKKATNKPDKCPDFIIKILQFLVPLLILGLVYAVRKYTVKE